MSGKLSPEFRAVIELEEPAPADLLAPIPAPVAGSIQFMLQDRAGYADAIRGLDPALAGLIDVPIPLGSGPRARVRERWDLSERYSSMAAHPRRNPIEAT
jgi:hypothetical protein